MTGRQLRQLRRIVFIAFLSTVTAATAVAPAWGDPGEAIAGSAGSGSASGSGSGSGSGSSSGSATLPISSASGLGALAAAFTQMGKPYEWGSMGPHSWDCSALVQWAFWQVGVQVPRTTYEQAGAGAAVPRSALSPGDVVILNSDASHVGIYAGSGQLFNAYGLGVPVGFTSINEFAIHSIRRF